MVEYKQLIIIFVSCLNKVQIAIIHLATVLEDFLLYVA